MVSEELSKREREVIEHLAAIPFRSQAEIAADLGIGQRTLRSHISTILGKTGMADQRELVITELHRQASMRGLTMLKMIGWKSFAVVSREAVRTLSADDAIKALQGSDEMVIVLTMDVARVLAGLE